MEPLRWGWAVFWLIITSIAMALITPQLGVSFGTATLLGVIVGAFVTLFVLGITNR